MVGGFVSLLSLCRLQHHSPQLLLYLSKAKLSLFYLFEAKLKDISERIALLTQEIRDLQRMNEPHSTHSEGNHRIDRASHEQRELRLRQIKEELSRMMLKPTQREQ